VASSICKEFHAKYTESLWFSYLSRDLLPNEVSKDSLLPTRPLLLQELHAGLTTRTLSTDTTRSSMKGRLRYPFQYIKEGYLSKLGGNVPSWRRSKQNNHSSHLLTHSLTHSFTHSFIHSLTHSFVQDYLEYVGTRIIIMWNIMIPMKYLKVVFIAMDI